MQVIGWLADYSACAYYRLALPFDRLGDDFQITDRCITGSDVVVGQRVVEQPAGKVFQSVCEDDSTLAVFELDDDLFSIEKSNPAHFYFTQPSRLQTLRDNLMSADLVTVSTETLANVVRQYNDNVTVLPNYIPEALLTYPRSENDRVVIGWAGSATHSRDFGEVAKPLKRVLQKYGDRVEFHCIGANYTDRVESRRGITRHTPWAANTEEYHRMVDFDIALAPLYNSAFNASKSDLRLKEMAALGIPTVASNVGPYAESMSEGCPALPVTRHKEWEIALCNLIEDAEERTQRGKRAREWASHMTIEGNSYRWVEAYKC